MKYELLIPLVTLLATLSIASERLVEIIKGLVPWLGKEASDNPTKEGHRRAALQILAVICGCITALLAADAIDPKLLGLDQSLDARHFLVLGFLVSGGSGLWNSILSYLLKVKDIKGAEVERIKAVTPSPKPNPPPNP